MRCIGRHGYWRHNARGDLMKHWVVIHGMVITNTFFEKSAQHTTTYVSPDKVHKQLDYIVVSKRLWPYVRDAQSTNLIDLGSDHKAVKTIFNLNSKHKSAKRKLKQQRRIDIKSI
eukprot:11362305-Karenia_brevis.AAC.1